jgi:thiamine biosynthesis lipoprotein
MFTYEFKSMNTTVLLAAEGRQARVEAGFRQVEQQVLAYAGRFSRFNPASEVNRLSQSGPAWLEISPELFEMLQLSKRLHAETDGLFDPAVLPALERAGYDRGMDEILAAGGELFSDKSARAQTAGLQPAFSELRLDAALCAALLPEGMRLDLGGLAKGWIVERAAGILGSYAQTCLVDAGGDMFMIGVPAGETFWPVALEDPFDPARETALLAVGPGAVATSSVTRRAWRQDGQPRHHLIDPRSGKPAAAEWVSVTVIAAHTAQAEVLEKALLLGGPELAPLLLARFPAAEYIAVDRAGSLWGSAGSRQLMTDGQSFDAILERIL